MIYLFEDCALDPDRRELRRGGVAVPVEPQVFDLLLYLICSRERVVTQDDLLDNVWEGRIVSESTLRSRMNAARVAVGDNGDEQRLIRTLPRKGFRFVGTVREEQDPKGFAAATEHSRNEPAPTAGPEPDRARVALGATRELAPLARSEQHRDLLKLGGTGRDLAPDQPRAARVPRTSVLATGATLAALAAGLLILLWPSSDAVRKPATPQPVQRFDATVVPLVSDSTRRALLTYPDRPDAKALAIAGDGWGVADGAPNSESAKQDALRHCATRAKRICRVYAVGMDVVWSKASLPLPAWSDLHTEPLEIPLVPDEIPTLKLDLRKRVADVYVPAPNHKALAITTGGSMFVRERPTRAEAVRVGVEMCAEYWQRPCLVLSVDGFLTLQIPKSRKIARVFLPSTEAKMSDVDKDRIGRIFQGPEWRALARGKTGSWHAVAGAPSEAAAIAAALASCAQADSDCRLHAIGNFGVADE